MKKKDNWTESLSATELSSFNDGGESKEGSSSICSSSSSSSSGSSSASSLLGLPIRKAITTAAGSVSNNLDVSNGNGDEDEKYKKLGSKING